MPPVQPTFPDVLGACEEELKEPLAELYKRLVRFSRLAGRAMTGEQHLRLAALLREVESLHNRVGQFFAAEQGQQQGEQPAELGVALAPALAPGEGPDRGRFLVLLVESDARERSAMRQTLAPYFDVVEAGDTIEGARLARARRPDVVVTERTLPHGGDFSLLSVMREDEEIRHVPLVVVSAVSDTEAKIRAFELGAFDYMTWPVAAGEVIARIRNAIVHSESLRRESLLQATDDLTGLANRRYLHGYLTVGLRNAEASRSELTVVLLDQDNLKQINDQLGHAAGDAAIRLLAQTLSANKRATDCAARIGGDEFAVVMPGADRLGGEQFVQRVEEELKRHPLVTESGGALLVGASFGMASAGDLGWTESCEKLLERAGRALYEAKRSRKAQGRLKLLG